MDIRDILETRALHDAILVLDARLRALEEALTKPEPPGKPEEVPALEEEVENG